MPGLCSDGSDVRCLFFQHARGARPDRRLNAVRQTCEQPGQHDLDFDVILRDIDRSTDVLFQRGQLECEAIAAPDLLVDLENPCVFRADAAEPGFQAAGRFFLAELVGNGDDERLSQCRASEQCDPRFGADYSNSGSATAENYPARGPGDGVSSSLTLRRAAVYGAGLLVLF